MKSKSEPTTTVNKNTNKTIHEMSWEEILQNSKPISREEMFRQIQEQKRQAEEKRKDTSNDKG